jgi:hypothetical protein
MPVTQPRGLAVGFMGHWRDNSNQSKPILVNSQQPAESDKALFF